MSGLRRVKAPAIDFRNKEMSPMSVLDSRNCRFHDRGGIVAVLAICFILFGAIHGVSPAGAAFGFTNFDVEFVGEDGESLATQAGSHDFAIDTVLQLNNTETGFFQYDPDSEIKDAFFDQIPGLVGDATAIPACPLVDFLASGTFRSECPPNTQVGLVAPSLLVPFIWEAYPVFSLPTPPGVPLRIGFTVLGGAFVTIDVGIRQSPDYNAVAKLTNTPQAVEVFGSKLRLWGNPTSQAYDLFRGSDRKPEGGPCQFEVALPGFGLELFHPDEVVFLPDTRLCPSGIDNPKPLLTLPRSCTGPAASRYEANSWQDPTTWVSGSVLTHNNAIPPEDQGFTGCGTLNFDPLIDSKATSDSTETGTGLDFRLDFDDPGLTSVTGRAQSDLKKAVVMLPEGVTINPSVGEGLEVCTPTQLDRETISSAPGAGCPNGSKLGTVRVETPLVDEAIDGSVFLAQQDDPVTSAPGIENPFDSLIAFYIVLRNQDLGILVKLPAKVEPDPATGQLVTTVDNAPQLPFSSFQFHFREGQRAPLVSPPACGTYTTVARLTPWARPDEQVTTTSTFEITEGIGDGPCPPGGVPPFAPDFEAGSQNNNAASYSPFYMRLIRNDGEQDMTKFSSILPPGVVGKLAGVDKCSDAAIEATKGQTGREELAFPTCPANSQIGRTLAGAGVGSALTYVKGSVYLAGPYKGAPLSVVSVTPAVAGPFDAGTVVVRLALDLNPVTAEVEVDGAASDPIPHILKGIPLKVRDLRVYVDRDQFIVNPTSCDPSTAKRRCSADSSTSSARPMTSRFISRPVTRRRTASISASSRGWT